VRRNTSQEQREQQLTQHSQRWALRAVEASSVRKCHQRQLATEHYSLNLLEEQQRHDEVFDDLWTTASARGISSQQRDVGLLLWQLGQLVP